jgi:release factor glutamine methyltransferase
VTIRELLTNAANRLGGRAARLDAELLLAHALGESRAWLYARPEHVPEATQRALFEILVASREHGEPIAYLTRHREFWSLDLAVTPDVLIPRHETELLVELALARIPEDRDMRIADLGTGSGAIALAIARDRPRARVLATDASVAALDVARDNARRLGIGNVSFAIGDWCAPLGADRFDLIVSNPPYIENDDPHLGEGDVRFEPSSALVAGVDGLDAIRRIVIEARDHLVERGSLLIEHGWDQAARVRALFEASGYLDVATVRDYAGQDRVTYGVTRARRVGASPSTCARGTFSPTGRRFHCEAFRSSIVRAGTSRRTSAPRMPKRQTTMMISRSGSAHGAPDRRSQPRCKPRVSAACQGTGTDRSRMPRWREPN